MGRRASSPDSIRKQLNISQSDLSLLLDTTRGQVSKIETGLRNRSIQSAERLSVLRELLRATNPEHTTNPWVDKEALESEVLQRQGTEEAYLRDLLNRQRTKLARTEERFELALRTLSVLHQLLENPTTPSEISQWITIVVPELVKKARRDAPAEQQKLRLIIAGLEGKITLFGAA
jgi:transcriptional regulator with XRE-family HTH domain